MKWYIPREHGAWSMWITPYLIGAFISPWTWMKVIAFAGLFFLYMSSAPLLEYVRNSRRKKTSPLPSLLIFSSIGIVLILFPVLSDPSILWYCVIALPFFLVNLYFARRKKERLIINDIAAIIALSASSLLAVHLGYGGYHPIGLYVWLLSIFYFTGTVFHAKSMIRERGNRLIKRAANLYHALYVIIPILFGLWWVSLIYLPSALKVWLTPFNSKIRPKTLGVMEIGFSVLFLIMSVWLMGQFVII
ncbi:membrane protein [Caldalkalibacillus thermarum]|uniref:YwiC-like family protein n=1 Tax=Caldalkalibacillus thermarum TaxID=296745 RepID=UPI001666CFC2|nr:YwiC-like family protein [Caldalkalibacillus thermarum]GGK37000.1 membrane protein [Caldalkalibacillus thermarum]